MKSPEELGICSAGKTHRRAPDVKERVMRDVVLSMTYSIDFFERVGIHLSPSNQKCFRSPLTLRGFTGICKHGPPFVSSSSLLAFMLMDFAISRKLQLMRSAVVGATMAPHQHQQRRHVHTVSATATNGVVYIALHQLHQWCHVHGTALMAS